MVFPEKAGSGKAPAFSLVRAVPILAVVAACGIYAYILRPIWFDEALTFLDFALLPLGDIFTNYPIPNNHILYTAILHCHLAVPCHVPPDIFLRLPSAIAGMLMLATLLTGFRKTGHFELFVSLLAAVAGTPFLIYATAVRGYMLSALFIAIAMIPMSGLAYSPSPGRAVALAVAGAAACATVPSSAVPLACCVIWFAPNDLGNTRRLATYFAISALPFIGAFLFYLPIMDQLVACARLGEGADSISMALRGIAAGIFASSGLLLVPAAAGLLFLDRRKLAKCVAIPVLLVAFVVLTKKPPFPRVFLPALPLLVVAVAEGLRRCRAKFFRGRGNAWMAIAFLAMAAVPLAYPRLAEPLSDFSGGPERDDFIRPFYMRQDYDPRGTAKLVMESNPERGVYMSFRSDPWATLFYAQCLGMNPSLFGFDSPAGRISKVCDDSLVLLGPGDDENEYAERFGVMLVPTGGRGRSRLFTCRNRALPPAGSR
ncbi:MAG: hypothetical protein MJ025_06050 [Victivallaceae bacterium]|nr:hypothetical protein [Victivallaceae bacterium]